jgi:hypothetical protein
MSQMFYNCYALNEIKMGGQVKSSCKLDYMFGGTGNYSNNCTFYYNSAYDYSKVLAKLPSNWSKVPY